MALTGRAGLLALAGTLVVALVAPSWRGLLLVNTGLAALLALDVALAASPRALSLRRTGASRVRLGEPAEVTLAVTNTGRRRARGLLRDAWPPSAGAPPGRARFDLPPGGRWQLVTPLRPTRRGDRRAEQVTVRTVGPLGLAGRQGGHRADWTVRVLPAFPSRRHLPAKLARLRELDGRTAVLARGQGTEFDSLREYVAGDDARTVDWRATARRGEVMVRTWRPERDRRVVLALDTGRTSAGRVGDAPRLDAAMDAALLLAALAARAGDRVDLLAFGRGLRAAAGGRPGPGLLPGLVDALAPLDPELVESDPAGLVGELHRRIRQRALVVLLTGLDTAAVTEGLLPALPPLVARHRVLLAAVADPQLATLAAGRGSAGAVYAAASAERARQERARTSDLLRRRGVQVVDAPPDRLPPALADAYLALKAAGRL